MNKLLLFVAATLVFAGPLRAQDTLRQVQTFPAPRAFNGMASVKGLLGSPAGLAAYDISIAKIFFFSGGDTFSFLDDSILSVIDHGTCTQGILDDSAAHYFVKNSGSACNIYNIDYSISPTPVCSIQRGAEVFVQIIGNNVDVNGDGRNDLISNWQRGDSSGFLCYLGGISARFQRLMPTAFYTAYYGLHLRLPRRRER